MPSTAEGSCQGPRRHPQPVSDGGGGLRRVIHHAGADLRRSVSDRSGAPPRAWRGTRQPATAAGAANAAAAAAGFRRLVRLRLRLPAGVAGASDPEDGRRLLDHRRPRRGAHAGRGAAADQALQGRLREASAPTAATPRSCRSIRSSSNSASRTPTRSTRASTSSIRVRSGPRAAASSWCCSPTRSRTRVTRGLSIPNRSSRSGTTSPRIEPEPGDD